MKMWFVAIYGLNLSRGIGMFDNKAVYTATPVAGGWAGAVMIWAGAVMMLKIAKKSKV